MALTGNFFLNESTFRLIFFWLFSSMSLMLTKPAIVAYSPFVYLKSYGGSESELPVAAGAFAAIAETARTKSGINTQNRLPRFRPAGALSKNIHPPCQDLPAQFKSYFQIRKRTT